MNAPDRAALIAAYRVALHIAESDPSLPMPSFTDYESVIRFSVYGNKDVRRRVDAIEAGFTAAGAGPFAGTAEKASSGDTWWWVSSADLGGVAIKIQARADEVAERKVVGVIEKVEWVRHPVADAASENVSSYDEQGGAQ